MVTATNGGQTMNIRNNMIIVIEDNIKDVISVAVEIYMLYITRYVKN